MQWASAQSYLIAALLLLLAAACHLATLQPATGPWQRLGGRAFAVVLYGAATLCKAAAVSAALLFVAAEAAATLARPDGSQAAGPLRAGLRAGGRALLANWAMVLAAVAAAAAAKAAAGGGGRGHGALGLGQKLVRAAYAVCFYAKQTVAPARLFLRYPARPAALTMAEPAFGAAAVLAAGLSLVLPLGALWLHWRGGRQRAAGRLAAVWGGWVLHVGLLSPTVGEP